MVIVAPAMNTDMWKNPLTQEHLKTIMFRYDYMYKVINPVESTLACGSVGVGAMAPLTNIVNTVKEWNNV